MNPEQKLALVEVRRATGAPMQACLDVLKAADFDVAEATRELMAQARASEQDRTDALAQEFGLDAATVLRCMRVAGREDQARSLLEDLALPYRRPLPTGTSGAVARVRLGHLADGTAPVDATVAERNIVRIANYINRISSTWDPWLVSGDVEDVIAALDAVGLERFSSILREAIRCAPSNIPGEMDRLSGEFLACEDLLWVELHNYAVAHRDEIHVPSERAGDWYQLLDVLERRMRGERAAGPASGRE